MAQLKNYRFVLSSASIAHNIASGSTGQNAKPFSPEDKGAELLIQNQSSGAVDVYVVESADGVPSIGSTSTTGVGGIKIAQNGLYQVAGTHSPVSVQADHFWVVSTSSVAIVAAQLLKI